MPSLFSWLRKDKTADQPYAGSGRTLRSTEFAFRLFENLNPGDRNLAVCPYGARVALGMLWEGSTGDTQREIAEVLGLNEDPNSTDNCYERLGRPLGFQLETERRGLEMLTANSLWCDDGFVPNEGYAKTLKEHYWAEIQTVSFCTPDAEAKINRWAEEKTHGRISTAISSLEEKSPLLTLNAVYFRGLWIKPFEAEQTKEEEFTLPDGENKLVPMMRRTGEFCYEERGGAQIVSLPYQGGMSMYVMLPRRDVSFPRFCAELRSNVGTFTAAMDERPGHVRLPRFRIETAADLTAPLKAMGMGQVFDPARAALEGISGIKPLYLMGVLQKDFVEVNEKGTEAAATTEMFVELEALDPPPPPPPFEMIVDRPFVFAVCDDFTRAVVFLGAVVDPLAAK